MISKRALNQASLAVLALFLVASAAYAAPDKKDQQKGRLLLGKVLDQQDNPVSDSVVYLTNMRTHAVKTYIVGQDGTYRFPGLTSADYEVFAQYKSRKSDTKSVSQFDERSQVYIDLKIDTR
ncbi:MAG: carboxypeptidase-like regulatory domain-containing protein [Candidatus Sulfotelmatobacter sp.]